MRRSRTPREQRDALRRASDKRWRRRQRNIRLARQQAWRDAVVRVDRQHQRARRLLSMTGGEVFDLLGATAIA